MQSYTYHILHKILIVKMNNIRLCFQYTITNVTKKVTEL